MRGVRQGSRLTLLQVAQLLPSYLTSLEQCPDLYIEEDKQTYFISWLA